MQVVFGSSILEINSRPEADAMIAGEVGEDEKL